MIRVLPDLEAVSRAAARTVAARARTAVGRRGRFVVALAGGHTPRRLYELLGAGYGDAVDWRRVHLFWGDERCVPPDHPGSNYRLARETLLERVPVPDAAVHRIRGELGPDAAGADYHERLTAFFGRAEPPALGGSSATGPGPRNVTFDLAILGLGTDGHTASLFPGRVQADDPRWARGERAPPGVEPPERVTVTLRALGASERALFLVSGADKRTALADVRSAAASRADAIPPAARVRPPRGSLWLVDRAAHG